MYVRYFLLKYVSINRLLFEMRKAIVFGLNVLNDIEEDLFENRRYSNTSQQLLMYQINCHAFVTEFLCLL